MIIIQYVAFVYHLADQLLFHGGVRQHDCQTIEMKNRMLSRAYHAATQHGGCGKKFTPQV